MASFNMAEEIAVNIAALRFSRSRHNISHTTINKMSERY